MERGVLLALALCAGCAHVVPGRAREVHVGGRATGVTQAELQQSLQRVTGVMSQRLSQASDPLTDRANPQRTEEALRRSLLYQASALDIASGPKPEVNLLDMLVFVTLTREAFEQHWLPEVFGEEGQPMLRALARSEADVWRVADLVLDQEQKDEVREYIRNWQEEHPDQVQVEAVRLSEFAKQAGQSAAAQKTRGLIASVKLAAKTADEALMLGERALFLGQRVPFLIRAQVRLGAMEVLGDGFAQLERTESLLQRSESLIEQLNDLRPTLEQAGDLTSRTETVVEEAGRLLDQLRPLAESFAPLMEQSSAGSDRSHTRLEALAESARETSANTLSGLREVRVLASTNPAAWREAEARLDATVRRWLGYAALVGVLWIVTGCLGYLSIRRIIERSASQRASERLRPGAKDEQ
jgi:hypothetical protein